MNKDNLFKYGWNDFLDNALSVVDVPKESFIARVIAQQGDLYTLLSEQGEHEGKVTGRFRYNTKQVKDYPVVGDFVVSRSVEGSTQKQITNVLSRRNSFSRKMPISGGRKIKNGMIDGGLTEEQIIASNIDTLFIINGLDGNFNIPRLERYMTLAKHQKLDMVILLNKMDLCEDTEEYMLKAKEVAEGVPIIPLSATTKLGVERVIEYLRYGSTVAFIGSSGVGKSTLLNTLLGDEAQITNSTSDHSGKGKHTTTHREIFFHKSGAMIIDTPGMKELQLWADIEDLDTIFSDITEIMDRCKFSNCTHNKEPGCAVNVAIENGTFSVERYARYKKSVKELERLNERKKEYNHKKMKRGR